LGGSLLLLGACTDVKEALGLEPKPPDEFTVIARAPLSLPPDYTLRPPRPGARRPQDSNPTQDARQTVFRAAAPAPAPVVSDDRSQGEQAFLKEAGVTRANPGIRQVVAEEQNKINQAETSFADKLLFWQKPPPPGDVIDPVKESQRLQRNAALGKPPGAPAGDVPTITRQPSDSGGFFSNIFGGMF
jgi:hypothetical protein